MMWRSHRVVNWCILSRSNCYT